jgi:hypothetical protein
MVTVFMPATDPAKVTFPETRTSKTTPMSAA